MMMRYPVLRMVALVLTTSLASCAHVDGVLGNIGGVLDATGDVLSGDLRAFGTATEVTLTQINADWKKNEITAQKKYSGTTLSIPGVVTGVSKTRQIGSQPGKFIVSFRDPTNRQCIGVAYTRDDLLVQQKKVSELNAGDRIRVVGVMDDHVGSIVSAMTCSFSFSKVKFTAGTQTGSKR